MTIQASHPAFRTALTDVDAAGDRLSACRERIGRDVGALLDGGWSGVAADAFAESWEQWRAGADDVLAAMATMRDLLDGVHRDLTARDVGSATSLASVHARLVERLG